ncbi:Serine/threonine-protein phosphatase 2A regulatory subunit B'' subunit gamma [Durusdinium trenchii]|uniref:Serine/threonine-protein phosphatase 2A regulatory subunit B'' subunit gamma n=1 Tax=Durusdinium trenchii TaxID=1381693 RepID=A0ABP0RIG4_9DINO
MAGRPEKGAKGRLDVARAKKLVKFSKRTSVVSVMTQYQSNEEMGYTKGYELPSEEDMEMAEEAAFRELQELEREKEEQRCPSLRSIPRFFQRKAAPLDESTSLRPRVLREARSRLLQRKTSKELLDEEDLHTILGLLKEQGSVTRAPDHSEVEVIDYNGFYKVRQELLKRGERFKQYFEPSHFLKFPRDPAGRIAIVPFFTFVVRRVNLSQTRVQLSYYDALGCGYLREKDMENFIFEMIPTMPQLNTLQEEFYPFYVFTAVRKFFFYLDPKRTGRVRIRDLLSSPILPELYELRQEHPLGDAEHNWFSMQSALKVYDAYLFLDNDQNGMLSRNELARFGSGMLTDVFIDRVFEEYQTYRDAETGEREMDYKTFLDFVLAMENKGTPQAVRYFWKLLDIHHTGCIDGFVINYFFRAIVKVLRQIKGSEIASVDDVKDEIFDMVRSKTTGIITLDDLLHCSQGGTVLSMLFDAAAFWLYDNRESLLMEQDGFLVKAISLPSLFPNAQGGNVTVGYPSEKSIKRTPSQLLLEKQQFSLVQSMLAKPKITGFQDLARFSNHTTSVVPVDQPLFSVHPPVVAFVEFEGLQTYETMVTLRNQDNVARRVKVCPPDSPFFELLPARRVAKGGTVASSDVSRDKIAPGMEVSYVVRFKPDARIDYSYDLKVVTEREEFSVPIRASGGSALLDFPDVIDFGDECIVGYQVNCANAREWAETEACRAVPKCPHPEKSGEGSAVVGNGALECVGFHKMEDKWVSVFFTPSRAERYECDLQIKYGELEAVATLRGQARNAEVSLSHSLLLIEDTYVGLESQGVVTIRNDSDVPIDFSWRLFSSTVEEAQHRLALHRQLKTEEMDELLYMQQANLSEDEESESGSDGERRRVRRERKVTKLLGRKYDSIMKAVEEDPMLFRDAIFKIEPLCGRLWPQTQVTCACCFLPKDALVYCATAFLSAVGQEDRAPLVLKGLGIGPKATFSYDELDVWDAKDIHDDPCMLDVGNVFVESAHRYEVQLLNQGDIEFDFRLVHREGKFAPRFKFTPDHGTIAVGGQCEIVVDFKPKELGPFHEVFEWALQGSATAVTLAFRGTSVRPKFEFDVDKINFGTVSFGFLNSRMLTLTNTSEVPCYYTLTVKGDEAPPNNEFEIIPSRGTLLPNCAQRIQVPSGHRAGG